MGKTSLSMTSEEEKPVMGEPNGRSGQDADVPDSVLMRNRSMSARVGVFARSVEV